jgi:hypothetical protein
MAINLTELQSLLDHAALTATNEKEVRKSLVRVENLLSNIMKELTGIYELLDGVSASKSIKEKRSPKAIGDVNLEAPYGRRKDGTPKQKPGRSK